MGPERRLNEYIRSVRDIPFEWGKQDCLTFSNGAFKAYHGFGYGDDWLGGYLKGKEPLLPSQIFRKFNVKDFDEAMEARMQVVEHVPPRGAVVATKKAERWLIGYALGICIGTKAAFLSRKGVVYCPLDDIDKAWIPR